MPAVRPAPAREGKLLSRLPEEAAGDGAHLALHAAALAESDRHHPVHDDRHSHWPGASLPAEDTGGQRLSRRGRSKAPSDRGHGAGGRPARHDRD